MSGLSPGLVRLELSGHAWDYRHEISSQVNSLVGGGRLIALLAMEAPPSMLSKFFDKK